MSTPTEIPTASHRLRGRIAHLKGSMAALQSRTDALEDERNQLRKENQALRRKLTHSRLIDDLLSTLDEEGPNTESASPSAVRRLYECLPPHFSFPAFFDAAEEEGLETDAARRCLQHFLKRQLLYQEGGQLTKEAPSAAAA